MNNENSLGLTKDREDKLVLSQDGVFYSIQGEGPTTGMPAVFIRLQYCNLQCVFQNSKCDTSYTWDKRDPDYNKGWSKYSVTNLLPIIHSYNCDRLVITGGEPLIQQHMVLELLQALNTIRGVIKNIEIETNGTIVPWLDVYNNLDYLNIQFNCSLKLSTAGMSDTMRIKPDSISKFCEISYNSAYSNLNVIFKFVVAVENDLDEICILQERFFIPYYLIYCMPAGVDAEQTIIIARKLVDKIKEYSYNLTLRTHILLWGNKKKV